MQETKLILHPAQKEIVNDNHRFRVVNCGRRFGKTTLAVVEMTGKAFSQKDQIISYIATTYQQARDISWNMLRKIAGPITQKVNESRLEITVATQAGGSSFISLRGWESIDTMRGMRNDFVVPDEVASYRGFLTGWHEVIRPTLTDTKGSVLFLSTPKGFNHFYDLYNQESKDKDYRSFHFTSYDNPFIPREEIDKAKLEMTEDRFAQEYLADFRKTEGLVYKEFDRSRHLYKDKIFNPVAFFAGVDPGFTNPCAIPWIYKDTDNNYYVTKEYYKPGRTDEEVADYISGCKFNFVYPDPEAPAFIEALRKRGINIREVVKGKDSIRNGISIIRELFKQNRLFIHESCENLIWELETYSYPDKKDFRNEYEDPIKENDHILDALRYALMMQAVTSQSKATVFVPHHQPIITPYNSPQPDKPLVFYPKHPNR